MIWKYRKSDNDISYFCFHYACLGQWFIIRKGRENFAQWAKLKQVLQITLISFPREENIHFRHVMKENNFYRLPFPMAQWVKNPSAMQEAQETQVWFHLQCRRHRRLRLFRGRSPEEEMQPTPVFLPEKSHGQRSLTGYSPWGHKESDMTEVTKLAQTTSKD